ncbi:hypothetical protein PsYK624_048370 [Phanerochaete sordida]|uniref:Uncharacterized protein n=1 Tax=Phanerochaete sordida TaxID=48140 RepID=A0A9P3G6I2_9APHY|nr:hypothetical protein PsYK624_048370 [Phanerochaete sordida]
MLLPRSRAALARTRTTLRRCARPFSTPPPQYPPKVRALPFVAKPEDVVRRTGLLATLQTFQKNYPSKIVNAARAYLNFGGELVWPDRMQAVYLPSWVIDAHASAKFTLSKRGDENTKEQTLDVWFQRSFMPGFSMDPLSQLSFSELTTDERLAEAVPFSEELTKVQDIDVLCLPYTATPFALPDAARTLSFNDAIIEEDFRFDPTTFRSDLITAYPLLVPVYLMQYVAPSYRGGEGYSFTLIVDASSAQGAVISENVFGLQSQFLKDTLGQRSWFDVPADLLEDDVMRILPLGAPPHEPFARPGFFSAAKPGESWAGALGEWVDARARARGAMGRYAALQAARGQTVDLADPRVRDVAEAPAFAEYLQQVKIVYSWRDTLEQLVRIDAQSKSTNTKVTVMSVGNTDAQDEVSSMQGLIKTMEGTLARSEAALAEKKPGWLREWEARQRVEDPARRDA